MTGPDTRAPLAVEFNGRAGEWFGIWIVNLLLSIVTIGIYSAWAKVRRRRYFNQNTVIAGRGFDYHATGRQILIGRLIVLAGLIVYALIGAVPLLAVVAPLVLLVLIPFLVVRALRFNARMTSWANVRFGFDGGAVRALLVYLLYPFLVVFSLYLLMPFAARAIRGYTIGAHRLGVAPFAFACGIGPFYRAFLTTLAWIVVVGAAVFAFVGRDLIGATQTVGPPDLALATRLVGGFYVFLFLGLLPAATIYNAFIRNAVFNATTLDGGHRLRSDIAPLRLVWIALSNAVVVVLTLGLMLPWAQIRTAHYLASHTHVLPGGSVDDFVSGLQPRAGAVGDAFVDIEGFDVGLPI